MNNNNDYKQKSSGKWKGLIIAFIFAVAATAGAKTCAYYIEKNNSKDDTSTTNEGKEFGTEHTPGVGEEPGDDSGENDGTSTGDNPGGNPGDNASNNKYSVSGISGDHQYIICNGNYTAKQAESFQIPGYHLATVTSGEEHVYIMSLMGELEEQSDGYWLGANDVDNEGDFKWCTDEPFDYDQWPPDQPDNTDVNTGGPENYLGIWSNGIWNDFAENEKLGFILEKDSVEDISESVFGENEGHEYIVCNGTYTYKEAERLQIPGYHLASTTSLDEYNYIMTLVNKIQEKSDGYWLGATDEKKEGSFVWCTGEEFSFDNWPEGQPDNTDAETGGPENYLGIWSSGIWNDFGGNQKLGFILEKD